MNTEIVPTQKSDFSKIINSRKRKNDVTIEEIRCLPGYENLTDVEIENIIESIKEFSLILNLAINE